MVEHMQENMESGFSETFERQVDFKSTSRPERSANVIRRLIESRVCNGKRLRVVGQWRRWSDGWLVMDVAADGTGEAMGRRWIHRSKHGGWQVRSQEPA